MAHERQILRSWKEIASYLGVGTRTAQRWKKARKLPVRQPGAKRSSAVLAFSEELDRWLADAYLGPSGAEIERPALAETLVTDLLWKRPSRPQQLDREVAALLDLGRLVASQGKNAVLPRISAHALALCKAQSAGFSILETDPSGREIFRWTATGGRMRAFEGGTTPASFSPCGVCLERNSALLFRYPEKFYSYLKQISPISELLLIPMHDDNAWLGTIWVICHEERRKFDREDVRVMSDLGSLASAVFQAERRGS